MMCNCGHGAERHHGYESTDCGDCDCDMYAAESVYTRTIGRDEMHPRFLAAYPNVTRATIGYTAADLEKILGAAWRAELARNTAADRLEYLRGEIRAEAISYDELAELADLAEYIGPDDVELLQWAGVPEFGHRRNTPFCAKCGGNCQYDDQGEPVGVPEFLETAPPAHYHTDTADLAWPGGLDADCHYGAGLTAPAPEKS